MTRRTGKDKATGKSLTGRLDDSGSVPICHSCHVTHGPEQIPTRPPAVLLRKGFWPFETRAPSKPKKTGPCTRRLLALGGCLTTTMGFVEIGGRIPTGQLSVDVQKWLRHPIAVSRATHTSDLRSPVSGRIEQRNSSMKHSGGVSWWRRFPSRSVLWISTCWHTTHA
jgi:hypothetical protein